MIKTTFRIQLETGEIPENLLDAFTLSCAFKCAPARHSIVEDNGLGHERKNAPENSLDAAELASGIKTAGELLNHVVNVTGRKITPEAINIYRETQAMRRSFGIRKEDRSNIDPAQKLPKILAEPYQKFDPEKLVEVASLPQSKRNTIEEVLAPYAKELPVLALRVSLLHRPFWEADDPVARQNWKKTVLPQTLAMVEALQRDLLRLEVPSNLNPDVVDLLKFKRLELRFDTHVLSIANSDINRFGKVEESLVAFYDYLNSGALSANDVVRIDAPFIDYDALTQSIQALATEEDDTPSALPSSDDIADTEGTNDTAPNDASTETSSPVGLEDSATETEETAEEMEDIETAEGESEETEEEVPRTHGIGALRLAEQTIQDAREHEETFKFERSARLEEEARAIASLQEQGIEIPVSERHTTWGVIFKDSTIRYFDSIGGHFRDRPENTDETDVDVVAFAEEIEAQKQAKLEAEEGQTSGDYVSETPVQNHEQEMFVDTSTDTPGGTADEMMPAEAAALGEAV